MEKKVWTIAALAAALSAGAQTVSTHVDAGATLFIGQDALLYNGGGIETNSTGLIDIRGNVMVVGTSSDKFQTSNPTGDNIILRLNDQTAYNSYGQLYIQGLTQSNITGSVTKEYLSAKHGAYQQMGLPFYAKTLSTLNTELGGALSDSRWSQKEVLTWNNALLLSDSVPLAGTTSTTGGTNKWTTYNTKANSYYMVGTNGWNPAESTAAAKNLNGATTYNVYSIAGVPVADGITETLQNAGFNVNYGTGGNARNVYTETYKSYLGDSWALAKGEAAWSGNTFGRNIYQFGNPYLTNLDLSQIVGNDGTATVTDGNNISNLIGIRYNSTGVAFDRVGGGSSTSSTTSMVTFTDAGTIVGDPVPVIKPMGFFVLKLADNITAQKLNFDTLRRFSNTKRQTGVNYSVTAAKANNTVLSPSSGRLAAASQNVLGVKTSSEVKQIGLIALDASGTELGRTYYAVYPSAETGRSTKNTTQAAASSSNVIGSFEEKKEGGIDPEYQNTYWLYINVANDADFKGKQIPVRVYSDAVKSLKIQLKEDGELIGEKQSKLSSGESFYLTYGTGQPKAVANGEILPLAGKSIGLSYGAPGSGTLAVNDVKRPSETLVVYDKNLTKYVVLFDKAWKSADVMVYDMSGKAILNVKKVSAQNPFMLEIPDVSGGYVVTAVSETGDKYVQKIKN